MAIFSFSGPARRSPLKFSFRKLRRVLAGAEGIEPPNAVLETAGIPLT